MKKLFTTLCLLLMCVSAALAATGLKGIVTDAQTHRPVGNANVLLSDQGILVITDESGSFTISNAQVGTDVLQIIADGYQDLFLDVNIIGGTVHNLGTLELTPSGFQASDFGDTDLFFEDMNLLDEENSNQSIATIQGATDDVYYQKASFNFQPVFFRMRGYNSDMQDGYINGVNFRDYSQNQFSHSGLGGMTSTTFRQKTVAIGLAPSSFGYGNVGGATNYTTYASEYAPGFRGMATYTNSDYMLRAGLMYSTGVLPSGWAFSATIMGRYAPEGSIEGTFYNNFSYAFSAQKIFNDKHSLNISTWGSPMERATARYSYQEAFDLLDNNLYNPAWGWFDGKKRSSRIRNTFDPSAIVNWIWKPQMGTTINTAVAFRHNRYAQTDIARSGNSAEYRPDYYRYLPSYSAPTAESGTPLYDYQLGVYEQVKNLWVSDPNLHQINWNNLYNANRYNNEFGNPRYPDSKGMSDYMMYARHTNTTSWMFNSYINHRLSDTQTLQGGLAFTYSDSHYYNTVYDLLGGEYWLDVETFYERDFDISDPRLQNDANNPNRRVRKGDIYGQDYHIYNYNANAWVQHQIRTNHWDVNYGLQVTYTNFYRHGNMRNGRALDNSYGTGKRHTFDDASIKAGATYKLNGRNYFVAHGSYGTMAPTYWDSYINPGVKDDAAPGLTSMRYLTGDISYVWNYARFRGSVTGYWTGTYDGAERKFFYDDYLGTNSVLLLAGVDRRYMGVEVGMSYLITPSLTLSAVGTFSRAQYTNRPTLIRSYENGLYQDSEDIVYLKNYYIGQSPQQAYNVGLDYAAPHQWFFSVNASYMGDGWVAVSPLRHISMDNITSSGETMEEIMDQVKAITKQTRMKDAFVLNASIGKIIYTHFGSVNFNLNVSNITNNRNIQMQAYQQNRFDYSNLNADKYADRIRYYQGIKVNFNVGIRF
ncbi:MAG: TonB-dependent receptor [Bacteroidales bacterium]|nr:TonB-dependent receptor [Bacteroidales bacterium]